jgi:hypothetical protein
MKEKIIVPVVAFEIICFGFELLQIKLTFKRNKKFLLKGGQNLFL